MSLKANDPVVFEVKGRRMAGVKEGVILSKTFNYRKHMWEYVIQAVDVRTKKSERWTLLRKKEEEDKDIKLSDHNRSGHIQQKAQEFDDKKHEIEVKKSDAFHKFLPFINSASFARQLFNGQVTAKIKYGNMPYPVKNPLWKASTSGVYPVEHGRQRRQAIPWTQVLDLIVDGKSLTESTAPKTYQKMFESSEIDWKSAPSWAEFYAIDKDGTASWFSKKPMISDSEGRWVLLMTGDSKTIPGKFHNKGDWHHSLQPRPK